MQRSSIRDRSRLQHLAAAGLAVSLGACLVFSMGPAQAEDAQVESKSPGRLEFVGKNLFSTANGVFHEWRVVESRFDPDAPEQSYAVVEVTLASLDTGIDRRDTHLRTPDFFDVERYPTATARGHSLVPIDASDASDAASDTPNARNPRYSAQFDIDLHGVQKTLQGEIEVVSRDPLVVEGRVVFDRLDFGVGGPASRWNPVSVRAEIPVTFRVEL